jgi:hypothetical protein
VDRDVVSARTGIASVAVMLGILAVIPSPPSDTVPEEWRRSQELAVREAVLRDLLDSTRAFNEDADMSICVGLGLGELRGPGPVVDAPLELRERLRGGNHAVLPLSRCHVRGEPLVDSAGRPAVEVAVGTIRWVSKDFVKTRGYALRGSLSAIGFDYTLSLRDGKWLPDRVVATWVS